MRLALIGRATAFVGIALAIGVALGAMGLDVHGRNGPLGTDPGTMLLILMIVCWMIFTLLIGQTVPRRRRPVMISGVRTRTVVTEQLKQAIVAAYIGDGQPSIREVAAKLKVSYGTVHRVLDADGLTRPRGVTRLARQRKAATA